MQQETKQTGLLWRLSLRLWPALAEMDERRQLLSLVQLVVVYITALPGLFALGLLIAQTDLNVIEDHLALLGVALVALLIMTRHESNIYIELENGDMVPTSGSLSSVVIYSLALVVGPGALWIAVLLGLITTARTVLQARQAHQHVLWNALSTLFQNLSNDVLGGLVGLVVYELLGGSYPPAGLTLADWGPALIAVTVAALSAFITPLIILRTLNSMLQQIAPPQPLGPLFQSWLVLTLAQVPFIVFGALLEAEAGPELYAGFVVGVVVVNYLGHHLSRSVERSQQRTRELAALEALGEAIIEAPPDLSTLPDLLNQHLNRMFPQDRVDLRLFDAPAPLPPLPAFTVTNAAGYHDLDASIWDALRAAPDDVLGHQNILLPGTNIRTNALTVKISADAPGEEGGVKELFLGGVNLMRVPQQGRPNSSLPALQALASQIGSAYYRALVHLETLEAQKMAQELELAGQIQAQFLPTNIPQRVGWQIAASLAPARQTSGDFYDFIDLPDDRLIFVVADVADKGTGAALYMALSRTLIRTFALQHPHDPGLALQSANDRILSDARSDQFVTVFYACLDPASATLHYANAGHNPAFLLRDGSVTSYKRTGTPMGMFEGLGWASETIQLQPGDVFIAYSDGVSEAQNATGDLFDDDRLIAAARSAPDRSAHGIREAIFQAVSEFVAGAPQFDDMTLLILVRE